MAFRCLPGVPLGVPAVREDAGADGVPVPGRSVVEVDAEVEEAVNNEAGNEAGSEAGIVAASFG